MSHIHTFIIAIVALFGTLAGSNLFAQNAWETLPVFHGGRVMPLHTFAQQIAREICGTTRPFIVRDDTVIAEFNQIIAALREQDDPERGGSAVRFPFLAPPPDFLDGRFGREFSDLALAGDVQPLRTELSVQRLDRFYIEYIRDRIRLLIPAGGRSFTADELLLSWICEPEVWQYIPIFLVPETDYLDEIFDISVVGDARTSQRRVSLHQLDNSPRFQQRLAEIIRRHELGQTTQVPIQFDQITERLESQSRLFQELTFHPQRHRPTRMLSLLYQAAGLTGEQSSYVSAFDAWGFLLTLGEVPGLQTTTRLSESSGLTVLHPTTRRWHDIEDKLHLLMQIYDRTDSNGYPIFPNAIAVEQQYEILMDLIEINLAEAAVLMESIYPGIPFRPAGNDHTVNAERLLSRLDSPDNRQNQVAIRQIVLRYYYTVKKLRKEIEAAYLALYDNGRSFRFLPVLSPLALELGSSQNNFGVQPWASAQMILGSGEAFVRRFFDPVLDTTAVRQLPVPIPTETADETNGTTEDDFTADETNQVGGLDPDAFLDMITQESWENTPDVTEETTTNIITDLTEQSPMDQLFQPSAMRNWLLQAGLDERSVLGGIRASLRTLFASYSVQGDGYGRADFSIRAGEFQSAVRQTAARIENHRELLVDGENQRMVEQFAKTAYPRLGVGLPKLLAEYNYGRLNPFYWMWVFSLLAVFLNGGAYVASVIQRERGGVVSRTIAIHSTANGGQEETDLSDYTNTIEEWLFIGSVAMLTLSMFIAFIGGVMRASITGWAPVTNMYETIVMMAFVAAMIGVWYALYPLLHPALKLAWIYSQFPRIGTLLELSNAVKAQKTATSLETAGEAAMREAAVDFGVPGGRALGEHPTFMQDQGPKTLEAQRRVKVAQRKTAWQCMLAAPRLILTFIIFYAIVLLANEGNLADNQGFWSAAAEMFRASDIDVVDWLAVVVSVVLLVWVTPHILLTLFLMPVVLGRPAWIAAEQRIHSCKSKIIVEQTQQEKANAMVQSRTEMGKVFQGEGTAFHAKDTSGVAWLKQARNAALDRKLFIAIAAIVVFMAGLAASLNRVEFNPDIRPIAAVLRSNFWLTVHVAAFIVGYAAAFIAWGMAVVSLGYVIFGRYQRTEPTFEGQKTRILLPDACMLFSPVIERLIRLSLLLIIAGTVLGGRWADYSWGRFWSWDPKEVWALITILFLVIVFHGKIARYYGAIGMTVGALFASIAVIFTWYGVNYVFTGSVHAYGGGAQSNAKLFLSTFIVINILWGVLALLRYCAEVYGNEMEE